MDAELVGPAGLQSRRLRPVAPIERILRRIEIDPEVAWCGDPCWLWPGSLLHGYGLVLVGSRTDGTRRTTFAYGVAYRALVGPVPEGLQLDHLCRVRHCVNPAHLEPVTQHENFRRGNAPAARNSRKAMCPQCGGPYTARADGHRRCTPCGQQRRAERRGTTVPL